MTEETQGYTPQEEEWFKQGERGTGVPSSDKKTSEFAGLTDDEIDRATSDIAETPAEEKFFKKVA